MGRASIYKSEEGKRVIQDHYEKYLKTFQVEIDRVYVETSFGKTHVLVAGPTNGKPVFIFQGGNCINPMTLSWFMPLLDKYRIYAPDTIGHPGFSDENRISASDHSFARWISELLQYFQIKSCAFIGPSYGAGIILRLATFMPKMIDCAVLVSPAGINLGSKLVMIKDILWPMILFNFTSSEKHLNRIANVMSENSMKEMDRRIIGDVFKHTKLEQEMPKRTEKRELEHYKAPTLVIAGKKDIFFPESRLNGVTKEIIPNLKGFLAYEMGHFPSDTQLAEMNDEIMEFLRLHY
ncbi:alpha/beta fold hydrolase [Pseudoneobacillus sp. C159]